MKRSEFLKLLGLTAVSGAAISKCTFTSQPTEVITSGEIKPNTIGYFISLLPTEHQEYISGRYKDYFNNHCESMYFALGTLTEKAYMKFFDPLGNYKFNYKYDCDLHYLLKLDIAYSDMTEGQTDVEWPKIPSITID